MYYRPNYKNNPPAAAGPLTVKGKTINVSYSKLRKKSQVFKVSKALTISGYEDGLTYEKIKGSTRSYVKLTTDDQFIAITSASVNGCVSDEMECVHEGRDIEIGFNCRYLINSVKVAEGENIKITLKSATQAITIEPAEESDEFKYFYMILPVRMNEQK